MKTRSSFSVLIFFYIIAIGLAIAYSRNNSLAGAETMVIGVITYWLAIIISSAIKIADQWEKAVVLTIRPVSVVKRGPGLFFIIPIIDNVAYWIDNRVISTSFTAEKTLTKDTVPVDVDAVCSGKFWMPRKLPSK
jgi:regulator of protease activity HflC (stomatin/prohibitin superfamily)